LLVKLVADEFDVLRGLRPFVFEGFQVVENGGALAVLVAGLGFVREGRTIMTWSARFFALAPDRNRDWWPSVIVFLSPFGLSW
jgi:hypothetical protein